jgi:ethanolamine ammonia-lyase large subunit
MKSLKPLEEITVPEPPPDETYSVCLFDQDVSFDGLKALLGAADVSKAADWPSGR